MPGAPTIERVNAERARRLAETCVAEHGYRAARVLPDGSVAALLDLMFTRAICLGVNDEAWTRRFCFEDKALADRRFAELVSEDDEPQGYVARRPQV